MSVGTAVSVFLSLKITSSMVYGCIFFEWEIVLFIMGGPKGNDSTYTFAKLKGTENYKE